MIYTTTTAGNELKMSSTAVCRAAAHGLLDANLVGDELRITADALTAYVKKGGLGSRESDMHFQVWPILRTGQGWPDANTAARRRFEDKILAAMDTLAPGDDKLAELLRDSKGQTVEVPIQPSPEIRNIANGSLPLPRIPGQPENLGFLNAVIAAITGLLREEAEKIVRDRPGAGTRLEKLYHSQPDFLTIMREAGATVSRATIMASKIINYTPAGSPVPQSGRIALTLAYSTLATPADFVAAQKLAF